jgi:hypothetical protein
MSVDNRTQLNDCETFANGWTAAAQGGDNTTTGQFYEGTGSIESQHSDSDQETWTNQDSAGSTFNLDFTDTTIYMLIKDGLVDSYANGGAQIIIGDGTNRVGYDVAGNDAQGLPLELFYRCYKLDVAEVVATPGGNNAYAGTEASLSQSAITQIGYGSLHLAKAVGNVPNAFIDSITYLVNSSYALTINGGTVGTPETMADVAGDDITNGWGMVGNPLASQYVIFANTEWGTPSGTADSYFVGTDEQWYFVGDNLGGRALAAGNFIHRLIGNGTGTNSFVLTRVIMENTGTRGPFDLSNSDMDIVQLDGCSFTNFGVITMPTVVASDKFCNNTVFNNCDQMDLQSLDMDGCVFNGSTDANGFFVWDENTTDPANQDNFTLNSDGTGNGIEVAPTGAGPFTYNIDGYTFDGFASQAGTDTNRVFFINPSTLSADITINLTNSQALNPVGGGSDFFSHRDVASYTGTLVIQQTVTLTVQVDDEDAVGVGGARVRIEELDGTLVSQGTANASGLYTDSFVFSSDLNVRIKARLKRIRSFRTTSTITSSGMTVVAAVTTNKIVDLP